MNILPAPQAVTISNIADGTTDDQRATAYVASNLNTAIVSEAKTMNGTRQIFFNTTDVASFLVREYSDLTIVANGDLTPAFKDFIVSQLISAGYASALISPQIITASW